MNKFLKIITKLVLGIVAILVIFCVAVYCRQEWFFFNPTNTASNLDNAKVNGYPAKEVNYKSQDGTDLLAWYTAPKAGKKVIVFMHGNSYNIEKFYHKMIPLMEEGYGTMMVEYRGFGGVKGRITQQNLRADAKAAVNYLHSLGFKNKDIVIYGMSMGSHMATHAVYSMGQEEPFAGLILEVPFNSLVEVAKSQVPLPLPFDLIMPDKYDNKSEIAQIKSPLLILGGTQDPTVPVTLAQDLFQAASNPKEILIYQGGAHSDLYNFRNYRDIMNWLKKYEKD